MILIVVVIVFGLFLLFPSFFGTIIGNLLPVLIYAAKDFISRIRYKRWRLCRSGEIIGFIGLFGRGKTLSAVHHLAAIYRRKNGLRVYCPRRKCWVTQRIHIVSNVNFTDIPYESLQSLEQVVLSTDEVRMYDDTHNTLTVTLVLIDEASSELYCRDFRENINPLVLNAILTCRHWNISIFYTAQRFAHVDSLLRQVTSYVLSCEKLWRFQIMKKYDAWELEQATNPANIRCNAILCWFVRQRDYEAYDTYAVVQKLKKSMKQGQLMTSEEVLALQVGNEKSNMDGVRYSKRYRKRHKKLY